MLMDGEEGVLAFGLSEADDNVTDIVVMFVAGESVLPLPHQKMHLKLI